MLINSAPCCVQRVIIGHIKLAVAAGNTRPKPQFVIAKKRKDFFAGDGIHIPDNQKLLAKIHHLRHVFTKEREGRVGHDDVSLTQQFFALLRTEVARFQLRHHILIVLDEDFHVGHVHCAVAVHVRHFCDDQLMGYALLRFLRFLPFGKEREFAALNGRAVVTGTDEFLQPKLVET